MLTLARTQPAVLAEGDRLALAKLVARNQNAHVLGTENVQTGIVNIADAVSVDLAFFVQVDHRILALDGDKEGSLSTIHDFVKANKIEDRAVICTSGGAGNRAHLFLKVTSKKEYENLKKKARFLRFDVRQSIRPPGTAHRNGIDRSELWEITAEEAIRRLSTDSRQDEIEYRLRFGWPDRSKDQQGGRSAGLYWLAIEYQLRGYDQCRFIADVRANPQGAGEKIQNLDPLKQELYLRRTWEKARLQVHNRPKTQNATEWFLHAIRTVGLNNKLVNTIGEIYKLAVTANSTSLRIGVRTLPQSTATTSKHLKELTRLGLLKQTSWFNPDVDATHAQTFGLTINEDQDAKKSKQVEPPLGGVVVLDHVFRNLRMMEALHNRRSATRVVLGLILSPNITAAELALRMGLNRRSVELQLRWLREIGLVEQRGGRYLAVTDSKNATRVAMKRGTYDQRRLIAERQKREREAYRLAVELRELVFKTRAQLKEKRILYRLDQQARELEAAGLLPD